MRILCKLIYCATYDIKHVSLAASSYFGVEYKGGTLHDYLGLLCALYIEVMADVYFWNLVSDGSVDVPSLMRNALG